MADVPSGSSNAEPADPFSDLPVFVTIPYYENSADDPIYRLYVSNLSQRYLAVLDWTIKDCKKHFIQHNGSEVLFPNLGIVLNLLAERRRTLLLEEIIAASHERPDLEARFLQTRVILSEYLTEIRRTRFMIAHFVEYTDLSSNAASQAVRRLLGLMNTAYNQLALSIPMYLQVFQEAYTYADQRGMIPPTVTPYLDLNQYFQDIDPRITDLVRDCRAEIRNLMRNMPETPACYPPGYLTALRDFVFEFPFQHWTFDYMFLVLNTTRSMIKNYLSEETICRIDVRNYGLLVKHREILIKVIERMTTILQHHKDYSWADFRLFYGKTAQNYFLETFNRMKESQKSYDAALYAGLAIFAQRQLEKSHLGESSGTK